MNIQLNFNKYFKSEYTVFDRIDILYYIPVHGSVKVRAG